MKMLGMIVLGLLIGAPAFAHDHDKTTGQNTNAMGTDKTVSDQYSPNQVQEKRSLKHKNVTRKDSLISPTSPSNKDERRAKAAAEGTDSDADSDRE